MEPDAPERIRALVAGFPRGRTWLLSALQAVQEAQGWLSQKALTALADHFGVPREEVYSLASDCADVRLTQPGAHLVRVCTGVSCRLTGSLDCLRALETRFEVKAGETTPDDRVTLEEVSCLFICAVAPVVEVDGSLHGRVTPAEAARAMVWFRFSRAPKSGELSRPRAPLGELPGENAQSRLAHLRGQARQRAERRPPLRLLVQAGSCGAALGAHEVLRALRIMVAMRGVQAEVLEGACNGMCYGAIGVEVLRVGWPRLTLTGVTRDSVPGLLQTLLASDRPLTGFGEVVWAEQPWRGLPSVHQHAFLRPQQRVLLGRCGAIDPEELDDALLHGAYASLAVVLDSVAPHEVIARARAFGLQGRAGAHSWAATGREECRQVSGSPKCLVVNAGDGDPAVFHHRHLTEGDPHQLLEGVLLAAYAAGASRAILYVDGKAQLSARRMARAIGQAEDAGLLGGRVLGTDFALHVEMRRGPGGLNPGEEMALRKSIEGRVPRARSRFVAEAGPGEKPTVIGNVETLAALPALCAPGGAWSGALSGERAKATKLFCLSGLLHRPGIVEVEEGVTLRSLVEEMGGGLRGGHQLKAIVVDGASRLVVPPTNLDTPMEPGGALCTGSGAVVAVPDGSSI